MRKWLFLIVLLLVACNQAGNDINKDNSRQQDTIIDWIDFIKINNHQYIAMHTTSIADHSFIGNEISTVHFKVAENINDINYKPKNGDASFLQEGTPIYSVKGKQDIIAIKDSSALNGYRLYQKEEHTEKWQFEHIDKQEIVKVEVWQDSPDRKRLNTITEKSDIGQLLNILQRSQPRQKEEDHKGNLTYYELVFYQKGPLAHNYPLIQDAGEWYWLPWEEEVLTYEIERFINKK